jgi:hypothetical protein
MSKAADRPCDPDGLARRPVRPYGAVETAAVGVSRFGKFLLAASWEA